MAVPAIFPPSPAERERRQVSGAVDSVLGLRLPARRDVNFILNVTLPWLLIVSFVTGWIASWMGLTEFGLHKYSSIAVFVIAIAHLALHWRSLAAHLRRLVGGGRPVPSRPVLRLVEHESQGKASVSTIASVDVQSTGT